MRFLSASKLLAAVIAAFGVAGLSGDSATAQQPGAQQQGSAAVVEPVQGNVRINPGEGFRTIAGPTGAPAGTMVMVGRQSAAVIVYANGCRFRVEPGMTVRVQDPPPPCDVVAAPDSTFLVVGAAAAAGIGVAIAASSDKKPAASP